MAVTNVPKASHVHHWSNRGSETSLAWSLKGLPRYIEFDVTQPISAGEAKVLLPSLLSTVKKPKIQGEQGILVRTYVGFCFA